MICIQLGAFFITTGMLQRWLYCREHLKYVWNVYCVVINHRWGLRTTVGFLSTTEEIIFVLFKDTSCLVRNLKHRCSPRSALRTTCWTSFEFRKKNFTSQRDATRRRPAFKAATHEDNKKMNNRDVFISDSIILASIFCRTRGLDLCGLTIEPSNYCAVPAEVPWSQDRKQIQHLWNDWFSREYFKSPLDATI